MSSYGTKNWHRRDGWGISWASDSLEMRRQATRSAEVRYRDIKFVSTYRAASMVGQFLPAVSPCSWSALATPCSHPQPGVTRETSGHLWIKLDNHLLNLLIVIYYVIMKSTSLFIWKIFRNQQHEFLLIHVHYIKSSQTSKLSGAIFAWQRQKSGEVRRS